MDTTLIKEFLDGIDDQKYIVAIEGTYSTNIVHLVIDDPEKGKYFQSVQFKPYTFCKDLKSLNVPFFKDQEGRLSSMKKHNIEIKKLRTDSEDRLENGYKYLVETNKTLGNLIQFFKGAGFNIYGEASEDKKIPKDLFITQQPVEQFLIQTGKRLFKGYEKYSEIHKFYFDLETTGLNPKNDKIFLIGVKDNKGFEEVIEVGDSFEGERNAIIKFFDIINKLKPSIIAGYNSEAFDFDFLIERSKILQLDLGSMDEDYKWHSDIQTSLNPKLPLRRKKSSVKFGNEQEWYTQTIMWGYNVIDVSHAVRRAQAINSDIKSWGLKWICKYADIAKKNRVYVEGDKIYKIYNENNDYYFNPDNSNYILNNGQTRPDGYINNITGKEIIKRYLLDDLWETEQVDEVFNQQSFMMSKMVPTSYSRATTMGTAALWKLLMVAYSYENKLAIPKIEPQRDFVGGLSRLFRVGYSKNVLKMDFAGLYPSIQLTHDIFPKCDITNVLKQILTYFRNTRNEYKKLAKKYEIEGNEELSKFYDIKQLPIKILNNSLFGALSAPNIFPWGDMDCGERITCTGRQYLRRMVQFFQEFGYQPIALDTDGCNMIIPDDADKFEYKGKKSFSGVLEKFNETMNGVMKLDEDGIWKSSINLARKNYANLVEKKDKKTGELKETIKFVGNTIKSKKLQTYMEKFFDVSIKYLLNGDGKAFIEYYYEYLSKIYNKQIPLIEIASKSKVKLTVKQYKEKMKLTNKNGKALPKQAHMELIIEHNLNPSLGEVVYYINNGKKKSAGDIGNSYIIFEKDFEANPNLQGDYNTARALSVFNTRIKPLLVCFKPEVRDTLLVNNPENRQFYTTSEMELINGIPLEPGNQDCIDLSNHIQGQHENEPLFEMSKPEIHFWNKVQLNPSEIFDKFTTELSDIKLEINQNSLVISKIKEKFKEQGIDVKSDNDIINEGDLIINQKNKKWFLNEVKNGKYEVIQDITEIV